MVWFRFIFLSTIWLHLSISTFCYAQSTSQKDSMMFKSAMEMIASSEIDHETVIHSIEQIKDYQLWTKLNQAYSQYFEEHQASPSLFFYQTKSLWYKGLSFEKVGQLDSAKYYYESAAKGFEQIDSITSLTFLYSILSELEWNSGNTDKAWRYSFLASSKAELSNNKRAQFFSKNKLLLINSRIGDWENVITNGLKLFKQSQNIDNDAHIRASYMLCKAYLNYPNTYEKAIEYCNNGLKVARENNLDDLILEGLFFQSDYYLKKNDFSKSIGVLYKAKSLIDSMNTKNRITTFLIKMCRVQLMSGSAEAEFYINELQNKLQQFPNASLSIQHRVFEVKLHLIKEDFSIAREKIQALVSIDASNLNFLSIRPLLDLHDYLESSNKVLKLDQEYYEWQLKLNQRLWQITNELRATKLELISDMQNQRIALDEEVIQKQQSLNKEQEKNLWIIVSFTLIVLFIILIFILFAKQKEALSERLKHEAKMIEMKLLRSQMNPHFISNALVSLQTFVTKESVLDTQAYIVSLAKLMRSFLDASRFEMIPLEDEIKMNEHYLKLQKLRFREELEVKTSISEDIESDIVFIPPLLIQPIIENAVEHGARVRKNGWVEFKIYAMQNDVVISISDGGSSELNIHERTADKISHSTNIIHERIQAFNKGHNDKSISLVSDFGKLQSKVELLFKGFT